MPIDAHLEERYASPQGAAAYRDKYRRSVLRRLSGARELAVVRRAIARARVRGHVLDCPCGAGRLVPTILERAERVTAADRSPAMLDVARVELARYAGAGRVAFAVAGAQALPFETDAFDAAVCHRLIHHVADPAARHAILSELARVSRGPVVLSFNDASTLKMRLQGLRGRRRRRIAWRPEALAEEARAAGLVLRGRVRRLAGAFSLVAVGVFAHEG